MKTEQLQPALAAPPAAASGLVVLGVPLDTWVLVISAVSGILYLIALIRDKYWNHYMGKRKEDADG